MSEMPPDADELISQAVFELENRYFVSGVGVPHSRDTEVNLHIDGKAYFKAIYDAISETGSQGDVIYITSWLISETFELKPGTLGIGRLLHDKAALGVDVRLIAWTGRFIAGPDTLDDESWWNHQYAGRVEKKKEGLVGNVVHNIVTSHDLRSLNPEMKPEPPPLQARVLMDYGGDAFGSRHQKYTVVYRKASNDLRAFVGGLDFFKDRQAAPHHSSSFWHDVGVELRAGAAASVWVDFRTRWEEARMLPTKQFRAADGLHFFNDPAIFHDPAIVPPSVGTAPEVRIKSTNSVRILRSYWPLKEDPISGPDVPWVTLPGEGVREVFAVYEKAINNAQKFIYVEDQWLNLRELDIGHDMLFPLVAAAANKDVKVIFIVPGRGDPADPDDMENNDQSQSFLRSFRVLISVFKQINFVMYRVNATYIHSKVLLIDDEFVAVGSANFANRSMDGRDTELQAAIVEPGALVPDFRVRLWADHLGVDPTNPTEAAELLNLKKSLGIFRPEWMDPPGGTPRQYSESRFHRVGP